MNVSIENQKATREQWIIIGSTRIQPQINIRPLFRSLVNWLMITPFSSTILNKCRNNTALYFIALLILMSEMRTKLIPKIGNVSVTASYSIAAISEVNYYSAVNPDRFTSSLLKECTHQLINHMTNLLWSSLDFGYIPKNLLFQSLTPFFSNS